MGLLHSCWYVVWGWCPPHPTEHQGKPEGKKPPKKPPGQEREIRRRKDEAFSEIEIERKRYDKIRTRVDIYTTLSTARVFI